MNRMKLFAPSRVDKVLFGRFHNFGLAQLIVTNRGFFQQIGARITKLDIGRQRRTVARGKISAFWVASHNFSCYDHEECGIVFRWDAISAPSQADSLSR